MSDLIWVGNTLIPRWEVYSIPLAICCVVIFIFVILTDDPPAGA
jgi:hypothetical protein